MTAPLILAPVTDAEENLLSLAALYANEELDDTDAHHRLLALTPPMDDTERWARFERLVEAVQKAYDLNEGIADWRVEYPELSCSDPSEHAVDLALGEVDEAVNALLAGGK